MGITMVTMKIGVSLPESLVAFADEEAKRRNTVTTSGDVLPRRGEPWWVRVDTDLVENVGQLSPDSLKAIDNGLRLVLEI